MADRQRFSVGTLECELLSDGTVPYERDDLFPGIPADELASLIEGELDKEGMVPLANNCLLIKSGDRLGLVDAGLGDLAKQWGAPSGQLDRSLEAAGVAREDIDVVIVSHGHPDHIGGLVRLGGDAPVPAFPSTPHFFWKDEWEFWTSEEGLAQVPEMMRDPARLCLPPLRDAGLVEAVDRETEVLPGVRLFPAPGHTPGHAAVAIASGDDRALYFADAVLHRLNVEHPEWVSRYEAIPDLTVETRRQLLERAAAEGATAAAFHIPGLWRVEPSGDGYRFVTG